MKVNIDKIKSLAKEKGISIAYICESVGMGRGYLNDIRKSNGGDIPDERLNIIVNILNTTADYLADKTDQKEPPADADGSDNDISKEIMQKLPQLNDSDQETILRYINLMIMEGKDKK